MKFDEKYRKSKNCPWSDDYEEVSLKNLDKYFDKEILRKYFNSKRKEEEKENERKLKKMKYSDFADCSFGTFAKSGSY